MRIAVWLVFVEAFGRPARQMCHNCLLHSHLCIVADQSDRCSQCLFTDPFLQWFLKDTDHHTSMICKSLELRLVKHPCVLNLSIFSLDLFNVQPPFVLYVGASKQT
jgi:hypothetical protein